MLSSESRAAPAERDPPGPHDLPEASHRALRQLGAGTWLGAATALVIYTRLVPSVCLRG